MQIYLLKYQILVAKANLICYYKRGKEMGKMLKDNKKFKITIRSARVNKGLTQEQASKALGIHETTLLRWEKDSTNIEYHMAKKMAELYKVSDEFLFFGKDTTISCK